MECSPLHEQTENWWCLHECGSSRGSKNRTCLQSHKTRRMLRFCCARSLVFFVFFFFQIERRRAILALYKVPVNKNENEGIKLNRIIIAINQPTGNEGSRPFSTPMRKERKDKLVNMRKIKMRFRIKQINVDGMSLSLTLYRFCPKEWISQEIKLLHAATRP